MKHQYAAYPRVNKQVVNGEYVFPFSILGHRGAPHSIPVRGRNPLDPGQVTTGHRSPIHSNLGVSPINLMSLSLDFGRKPTRIWAGIEPRTFWLWGDSADQPMCNFFNFKSFTRIQISVLRHFYSGFCFHLKRTPSADEPVDKQVGRSGCRSAPLLLSAGSVSRVGATHQFQIPAAAAGRNSSQQLHSQVLHIQIEV